MKEFKIIEVKEITTKDGRKFNAYKVLAKQGKKMDVRFTKTCTKLPIEPCTIRVEDGNWNVDNSRLYPILWIKEISEIVETQRKSQNYEDYFDSEPIFADEII